MPLLSIKGEGRPDDPFAFPSSTVMMLDFSSVPMKKRALI
jgi:hypothetical protein